VPKNEHFFPRIYGHTDGVRSDGGLTLRDFFAADAMLEMRNAAPDAEVPDDAA
jgi:hypothetical protein